MSLRENLRNNCGLGADPEWRRLVVRWGLVSLLLVAVACYFSTGFFQFDEYYQITEFVSYKLGKTPVSELAWEYHQQIRPWTQPAIYYVAARGAMLLGVENPFTLAFIFRAISGLCGWAAIVSMMLSARVFFADRMVRRLAVIVLALFWMIPYLAVRTSSESFSGSFFALGLATLLLGSSAAAASAAAAGDRRRKYPLATLLIAGVLFGLAFEFRYQIAFAVAGVVFWVLLVSSESYVRGIANACLILLGVLPPLLLGTAIDRWGYGEWTIAPWNYFYINVVQHEADRFGTAPVWWYFLALNEGFYWPLTLLLTVAMLVTWWRHPRHPITWATVPFFLAHSFVAHKELRFLFPMTLLAAFFYLLAFGPDGEGRGQPAWLLWLWERRQTWPAKLLYAMNLVALALACLTTKRVGVELQKYIYDTYGENTHVYLLGKKDPYQNVGVNMFFYRPKGFVYEKLKSYDQLKELLRNGPRQFLLITDHISATEQEAEVVPQATLVWRSYPSWLENYNYWHWLERSKTFSMYAIEADARPAEIGAKQTATDKR